jgi:hypothetical protein
MREPQEVEAELVEIAALADDETRFNRIIVWCATHADEIPMAMHILLGDKIATGHKAASVGTVQDA